MQKVHGPRPTLKILKGHSTNGETPMLLKWPGDYALVSHNNGITDFANLLTDVQIDNMPTCSVFAVKIHTDNWKEIKSAKIGFDFFDNPGLHKNH